MCMVFVISLPIMARAEESGVEEPVYYDTEQGRVVNDIDEYLTQLNNGTIAPFDSTITNFESNIAPIDVSEPSEKCSNVFGHKWDGWGNWKEVSRVHFPTPPCNVTMQRYRYCTRTHCNAYQIETDSVWISECSH